MEKEEDKKNPITEFSPNLFWDVTVEDLDMEQHKAFIINRVLDYGQWEDWKIILNHYGLNQIASIARNLRSLFPKSLAFISTVSHIPEDQFRCTQAIERATRKLPGLFRPPFGVTNPILGKAVRSLGLQSIGWSIRSLDTIESKSREEVCRRVAGSLHPGAVVLLHDRCDGADRLLEMIIAEIKRQGYNFAPIEEMLKIDVYEV